MAVHGPPSVVAVERVGARRIAALTPVVHVAVEPPARRLDDVGPHHNRGGSRRTDVVVPGWAGIDGEHQRSQLPVPQQEVAAVEAVAGAAPHLQASEVGG